MARKQKHEEHENHERWLVSYADFITLLFAFFVVMYSVSRVDNKKLAQAATSVQWALHYSGTGGVGAMPIFEGPPSEGGCAANTGPSASPSWGPKKAAETVRRKIEQRLRPFLQERSTASTVTVEVVGGRLNIRLSAARFFDAAQAALRPEALPVLDAIADELAGLQRPVRVEGHTDDSPVKGKFRNNWDLSAARAVTVVSFLETGHRIPAALLAVGGMGASRPLVSNETPAGREANRRIELVVELTSGDGLNAEAAR
jgi:chemotaxis protein MotB